MHLGGGEDRAHIPLSGYPQSRILCKPRLVRVLGSFTHALTQLNIKGQIAPTQLACTVQYM